MLVDLCILVSDLMTQSFGIESDLDSTPSRRTGLTLALVGVPSPEALLERQAP